MTTEVGAFVGHLSPMRKIFLILLIAVIAPSYCATNSDWLYFSATSGYQWPGWVYRLPLTNLSAPISRLEFTVNVTNFLTTPDYLYWSYLVLNNSQYTTYIGRASHNGSEIDPQWLEMSKCGSSAPYTWRYDIPTNTMWYQSTDATVCSLDLQSMEFTNYGVFRFSGGGIFNGGMELYRDPPSSQNVTGIVFGVEMTELFPYGAHISESSIRQVRSVACRVFVTLESFALHRRHLR